MGVERGSGRPLREQYLGGYAIWRGSDRLLTLAAAARDRRWKLRSLRHLPLLDGGTIEPPIAADAKPGQATLPEKPVDRRGMDAEVVGQFLNREDFFLCGHNAVTTPGNVQDERQRGRSHHYGSLSSVIRYGES